MSHSNNCRSGTADRFTLSVHTLEGLPRDSGAEPTPSDERIPRVLVVGGEDIHLRLRFFEELTKQGFAVFVAGSEDESNLTANGISYHRYCLERRFSFGADVRTVKALMRVMNSVRPDIVHAFDTKPGILTPIAGAIRGNTIVVRTITGMGSVFGSDHWNARILQAVYRLSQKVVSRCAAETVFQNQDDWKYFVDHDLVSGGGERLIPGSGVDLGMFADNALNGATTVGLREELSLEEGVVFIMVARLVSEKGVDDYFRAARQVLQMNRRAKFLLVGQRDVAGANPVSQEEIEEFSKEVRYLGHRTDVARLLAMSDVVVLPTRYREGVPRILLEAGAAGRAVITTDMPGCRDVVVHERNGLLIQPGDVQGLVNAMIRLAEDPSLRSRLGAENQEIVRRKFSLDRIVESYSMLYHELLNRSGAIVRDLPVPR